MWPACRTPKHPVWDINMAAIYEHVKNRSKFREKWPFFCHYLVMNGKLWVRNKFSTHIKCQRWSGKSFMKIRCLEVPKPSYPSYFDQLSERYQPLWQFAQVWIFAEHISALFAAYGHLYYQKLFYLWWGLLNISLTIVYLLRVTFVLHVLPRTCPSVPPQDKSRSRT